MRTPGYDLPHAFEVCIESDKHGRTGDPLFISKPIKDANKLRVADGAIDTMIGGSEWARVAWVSRFNFERHRRPPFESRTVHNNASTAVETGASAADKSAVHLFLFLVCDRSRTCRFRIGFLEIRL
jgi:hypothetical protein